MVTAVCAAILYRMAPVLTHRSPPNRLTFENRKFIQNLASYVHLAVDEGMGLGVSAATGLDVCAAVWSDHVYRTYTPSYMHILKGENEVESPTIKAKLLPTAFESIISQT